MIVLQQVRIVLVAKLQGAVLWLDRNNAWHGVFGIGIGWLLGGPLWMTSGPMLSPADEVCWKGPTKGFLPCVVLEAIPDGPPWTYDAARVSLRFG